MKQGLTAAMLLCVTAAVALAGTASERVFSRAALDLLEPGAVAVYEHKRVGTSGEALSPIEDGEIRITMRTDERGGREAVVTKGEAGKLKPVSIWPASNGNPVVPIFLESALRTMARVTGGSEYYIRNRIKEALGKGGTIEAVDLDVNGETLPAQHITFEPFENDKYRDRMGEFADLTLHFVVSDALPGDIVLFEAETGEGEAVAYREAISFLRLTEDE
ncbi:MAG: hypothetical protein AAFR79_01880 [Pseudomonadota bacterium]